MGNIKIDKELEKLIPPLAKDEFQQLENNLIVPRVMKKNVDVNGLTSILCILVGGTLFGVAGALLAVPLFIVLRTIFETWRKYAPDTDLI